jgi:hypothetical protein
MLESCGRVTCVVHPDAEREHVLEVGVANFGLNVLKFLVLHAEEFTGVTVLRVVVTVIMVVMVAMVAVVSIFMDLSIWWFSWQ